MEKPDEDNVTENSMKWDALKSIITNNVDYYKNDKTTNDSSLKLHDFLLLIIDQLNEAAPIYLEIESFCKEYDLDENTPANGFRSYLKIFDSAINHIFKIVKYVIDNRSGLGLLFRKATYTKEIESCNHLLEALIASLQYLLTFHSSSEPKNLFPFKEFSPDEVLQHIAAINQFPFYGRCLGFQFYDSIRPVLKFISISMACYSESYYSNNGNFVKATNSLFTSGKYYFDPELRAMRIVNLSTHASVDFCKNFWFLAESELMHSIPFVNYSVKVNRLIQINREPLQISNNNGEMIDIFAPGVIQVRLISSHRREGMITELKTKKNLGHILPKSNSLLFSKSHLVYLLEWAIFLNVPIISIDYSLSPESPYPMPVDEIIYAYCWAIKNAELLGTTCEKIVLCGDSAGANLCLATLLKCIDLNIRKPDGLFLAYCPILVAFDPSPSRLLCLMDPLVPFGFMMRCLKAYSNAPSVVNNGESTEEKNLADLEVQKLVKANRRNEELKRKNSLNVETEQEISENSEKSDSFEEISCFERHQTDSDIRAYISQTSDVASNDTLAGFLTGTDYKNSCKNTSDIISPDSILSATSLEEDSLPITIQKNEKTIQGVLNEDDLQPTTSIKNINNQYVDDFIDTYVLDAKQYDDGSIKPILIKRKVSRTQSEENIIFDVSRETLSMQSIQQKIHRVATTLVNSVTTTVNQITRTNRPIIKNYSYNEGNETKIQNDEYLEQSSSCSDFIFTVPKDPFLSPFYADDAALKQFPHIKFLSLTLDACLDDSIEFAKRLKKLNVDFTIDVLDGLPHGFLNFSMLSKEAHDGSKLAMERIAELFNISLNQDETKVKYFC